MGLAQRPTREGNRLRRRTRLALGAAVLLVATTVPAAYATLADTAGLTTTVSTAQLAAPTGLTVTYTCTPPSTILRRSFSSASGAGSLVVPTPSGTTAGDVLVAQVANRYGADPLTAPGGWNLIRRETSGTAVTSALFWRVAVAGEPASATFRLTGSSAQMAGGIVAYSGVHTSDPVDVSGAAVGLGGTASTPSVTTRSKGAFLVHTITKRQEDLPPPSGTSALWQRMSGNGTATAGISAGDEPAAVPGATAVRTSSSTFSVEWVTHTVALRPVPGTPTAQASWNPTESTWATGYRLERSAGGTVQSTATVPSVAATSTTDGPLSNGVAYSYRLWAYHSGWTSPSVSATFTPSC